MPAGPLAKTSVYNNIRCITHVVITAAFVHRHRLDGKSVPRNPTFASEDIVRAAVAVIDRGGAAELSARQVARELGASTAPIYTRFSSMEELTRAAMLEARRLLEEYMARSYTDRPFANMGVGLILFARDHRQLYRVLFLEGDRYAAIVEAFLEKAAEDMKRDPRFADTSGAVRRALLEKMWIYTHGVAALVVANLLDEGRLMEVIDGMLDVGVALIGRALGAVDGRAAREEREGSR